MISLPSALACFRAAAKFRAQGMLSLADAGLGVRRRSRLATVAPGECRDAIVQGPGLGLGLRPRRSCVALRRAVTRFFRVGIWSAAGSVRVQHRRRPCGRIPGSGLPAPPAPMMVIDDHVDRADLHLAAMTCRDSGGLIDQAADFLLRGPGVGPIDRQAPCGERGHGRVAVLVEHPLEDLLLLREVLGLVEPPEVFPARRGRLASLGSSSVAVGAFERRGQHYASSSGTAALSIQTLGELGGSASSSGRWATISIDRIVLVGID